MTIDLAASAADLRRHVRAARRAFARTSEYRKSVALEGAVREYLHMRAEGVSAEDACKGLEPFLRELFRTTKFTPTCDACDDRGVIFGRCTDTDRCGAKFCALNPEVEHSYARPCVCGHGDRFRQRNKPSPDDAIVAAGKTKRKTGFSRYGR